MNDEEMLLAGEFGTASRLSPKALRLYADRGLLVPARTDRVTGYRYYRRDQIAQARLISRLRALNLPLARISMLLGMSAEARHAELQSWLSEQEDELRRRRDLVDTLEGRAEWLTGEVATRHLPEQKLASRESRLYIDTLDDFIGNSEKRIRTRLREAGLSDDGQLRVHYHGCRCPRLQPRESRRRRVALLRQDMVAAPQTITLARISILARRYGRRSLRRGAAQRGG